MLFSTYNCMPAISHLRAVATQMRARTPPLQARAVLLTGRLRPGLARQMMEKRRLLPGGATELGSPGGGGGAGPAPGGVPPGVNPVLAPLRDSIILTPAQRAAIVPAWESYQLRTREARQELRALLARCAEAGPADLSPAALEGMLLGCNAGVRAARPGRALIGLLARASMSTRTLGCGHSACSHSPRSTHPTPVQGF